MDNQVVCMMELILWLINLFDARAHSVDNQFV